MKNLIILFVCLMPMLAFAQPIKKGILVYPATVSHTIASDEVAGYAVYIVDGYALDGQDTVSIAFSVVVDENEDPVTEQDSLATIDQVFYSQVLASEQLTPENYKRVIRIHTQYYDKLVTPPVERIMTSAETKVAIMGDEDVPKEQGKKIKKVRAPKVKVPSN